MQHLLFLTPGLFGFGKLATYDYFAHVERALQRRFEEAGEELETHVVNVAPTASIRRRAVRLAELVAKVSTSREDALIHILGHSTGGLDARLVASPSAHLSLTSKQLAWLPRLCSITTMNTPHYGTPLASFFATVSGQRILYAVSALTFIALSLGAPPLTAASALAVSIAQLDHAFFGVETKIVDRITEGLFKALEPVSSREVRDYLDAIIKDQGALIQLSPEAMDLFQAGVEDRPGVHYQSTCTMAPTPTARTLARTMLSPWRAVSSALFTTFYGITSRVHERYPCAAPEPAAEEELRRAFGTLPSLRANDGVVPTRSQAWGKIVWAGNADHLDVLGHYPSLQRRRSPLARWLGTRREEETLDASSADRVGSATWRAVQHDEVAAQIEVTSATRSGGKAPEPDADSKHVDWLTSGANFDDTSFSSLTTNVANGMLEAARDFCARRSTR